MTRSSAPESSADGGATAGRPAGGTAVRASGRWRSVLGWVAIGVAVVLAVLLLNRVAATGPESRGALDPESANEGGALALAEILRDQGVEVTVARNRSEAVAAVGADTTLAMADPFALTDDAVTELTASARDVVLLSSSSRVLRLLELGADADTAAAPVAAECSLPQFAGTGEIEPLRLFQPADGVTGCYPAAGGAAAVLVRENAGATVSLVEGARLFDNAHLTQRGNAALALALLGQTGEVVWYIPSLSDSDVEAADPQTLARLTPSWLTPAIVLLLLAGIVATIAAGRRFGPLVAETLPVTVRASETMYGRARLTAKAGDSAHAAEALQDGSRRRLAARLGLPASALAAEVADAAADVLRVPRGSLRDPLTGAPPRSDAELVVLARRLAELEASVDAAVHVERTAP